MTYIDVQFNKEDIHIIREFIPEYIESIHYIENRKGNNKKAVINFKYDSLLDQRMLLRFLYLAGQRSAGVKIV
jgi:antibiotic biosynthesis monooxygenase (ABM) superfamily enzyme